MTQEPRKDNDITWFFIKLSIGITIFLTIAMQVLEYTYEDISRYDVQTCVNTTEYEHCIYGLNKWKSMRAATAYGKDKDCVESRVEVIGDTYNLYFRTCNIFE
jgi:hypothetical protein